MSRIGKKLIAIPAGIEVSVNNGIVSVKKGSKVIDVETHNRVVVEVAEGNISFSIVGDTAQSKAYWGTYRALTNNAIEGLDKGFAKSLEIKNIEFINERNSSQETFFRGKSNKPKPRIDDLAAARILEYWLES